MSTDRATAARAGSTSAECLDPARSLPRLLPRRFGSGPASLGEHLARYGPLPGHRSRDRASASRLIAEVGRAGLTGRGGAAFPTARKLAAVAAAATRPVVVVNGTEGEPASAKDKVLMATQPHLVLDGAAAAALMVGARRVVFAAHAAVSDTVEQAVLERRAGWLDDPDIRVITAADGFVAGEASAVVNWAGGGRPVPTPTPPRLAETGLGGRPTLVQNAETLAHLALIARHGADWFRAVGTAEEPGSMLVTVIGAVADPGVREIEIGTPVADVLGQAGGPTSQLSAVLVGGYFGSWIRWQAAAPLPFSAAGLAPVQAAPGAGLLVGLPADSCGLAETARLARYLADESAGQCGPCIFGLDAIAADLAAVAAGQTANTARLHRWLGQVDGRGACRHPDGAVRMIRSALDVFVPELELHGQGWCSGTREAQVLPIPPGRKR
ncbi:MAG: NADH-ubiquinone oxidoreductase-F iron-sulfur binding region domain-containing protein [Streptosporangiaceae bacterium]